MRAKDPPYPADRGECPKCGGYVFTCAVCGKRCHGDRKQGAPVTAGPSDNSGFDYDYVACGKCADRLTRELRGN